MKRRILPTNKTLANLLSAIFLLFVFSATAQNKIEIKQYTTLKTEENTLQIDGVPDEEAWNKAGWSGDFIQWMPDEGEASAQKTEFSILYDEEYIYCAIILYEDNPEKIENRIARRDQWAGDSFAFQFDSYDDKQTAFIFSGTAAGVKVDGISTNNSDHADMSWDPVWTLKTSMTDYGWAGEVRIPLSELRFSDKESQSWGLEIVRYIFRDDELSVWQRVPHDKAGWASNFGRLNGLKGLRPKRQIDISPYVSAKFETYEAEAGNPFANGQDWSANGGLNGKIGITNDLILDFAVNPDFGQVEADPSEVNLSAFETFFSEKRPFFIEGKNITDYDITPGGSPWSHDNLLYSRRIGRQPRVEPELEDGEYSKYANYIKIPLAIKLTGKTRKGWSIGIIDAMTSETFATIDKSGDTRKESIEPFTNYFVGRLKKDFNKGNTQIGAMLTSVNRNIKTDALYLLPDNAYTGGLDFKQFYNNRKYYISGKLIGSKVVGSEKAISEMQLASQRYFQRPDADYVTFDSTRTELNGYGGNFLIGKDASNGFRFMFNVTGRSPGIDLNDVGYMRRGDAIMQFAWVSYKITKPFSIFKVLDYDLSEWAGWDFGGTNLFKGISTAISAQFKNNWSISLNYSYDTKGLSNDFLRGGPAMKYPAGNNFFFYIHSNQTKKVFVSAHSSYNNSQFNNAERYSFGGELTIHPTHNLEVSLSPSYSDSYNALQYVETYSTASDSMFLYSAINQKTFSFNLKINLSLSPELTVQYYGAPFVSSGLYSNYKEITDSKAEDYYDRYNQFAQEQILYNNSTGIYSLQRPLGGEPEINFENPDFSFKQFRSNLVIRWEYLPGSLLYLVWSQDRTSSLSDGNISLSENMSEMFKVNSNDVFLLKLSYLIRI